MRARVYAYIERDGRVAVFTPIERPEAGPQVPGGGVEDGESLDVAVLREAFEESGLTCEVVRYRLMEGRRLDPSRSRVGGLARPGLG